MRTRRAPRQARASPSCPRTGRRAWRWRAGDAEEAQVEVRECAALRARPHVVRKPAQVVVPGCFVLGVELHHPGFSSSSSKESCSAFSNASRACHSHQAISRPLGADRRQLEEAATDWPSSSSTLLESGRYSTRGAGRRRTAPRRRALAGPPRWPAGAAGRPPCYRAREYRARPTSRHAATRHHRHPGRGRQAWRPCVPRATTRPSVVLQAFARHRVHALVEREHGGVAAGTGSVPARCGTRTSPGPGSAGGGTGGKSRWPRCCVGGSGGGRRLYVGLGQRPAQAWRASSSCRAACPPPALPPVSWFHTSSMV